MRQPPKEETLSMENYPYRCGLGEGCPLLFSGEWAYDGRRYCVFIRKGLIQALGRNPKCPHTAREVGRNMVLRENDKDW